MIDAKSRRVNNIYRVGFKDSTVCQFVDIFIYDNCDDDSDERWKKYMEERESYISQLMQFCPVPNEDPNLNYWDQRAVINKDHIDTIISVTNKFLESNSAENGDYIIWGLDNTSLPITCKKGIYKSSDIFPLKKFEFNGRLYSVPNKYEEYLQSIYGDIYTLPDDILTHKHIKKTDELIEESAALVKRYSGEL